MSAEEAAEYTSLAKGTHAHAAETAAILHLARVSLPTRSGTSGDTTTATPEMGERFLALGVKSTLAVLEKHRENLRGHAVALTTLPAVSGRGGSRPLGHARRPAQGRLTRRR